MLSSPVDPCSSRELVLDLWSCDDKAAALAPAAAVFQGSYAFNVQQLKLPLKQKYVVEIRPANPGKPGEEEEEKERSLSVKVINYMRSMYSSTT